MTESSREYRISEEELIFLIRLTRDDAERLRDLLSERLAAVGFGKDYSLNEQGQMLEDLSDRFYSPD